MHNTHPVKLSFLHALGTAAYIAALVSLVWFGDRRLAINIPEILGPMLFLMVFVFSAAITASLVLGRPIMWYLNGQKKEAVRLFVYTLGWLALFMLLILATIASIQ
jgi:hypothetical protein